MSSPRHSAKGAIGNSVSLFYPTTCSQSNFNSSQTAPTNNPWVASLRNNRTQNRSLLHLLYHYIVYAHNLNMIIICVRTSVGEHILHSRTSQYYTWIIDHGMSGGCVRSMICIINEYFYMLGNSIRLMTNANTNLILNLQSNQ